MDRTRWTGVGVLAFLAVMLGTMWFVVGARADRGGREVGQPVPASEAAEEASPAGTSRSAPSPAPTWTGEAEADPAADAPPPSEATSETTSDQTETPGGSEEPTAPEPVRVEPPAAGADGDYTDDEYRAIYEELNRRSVQLARDPDPEQTDLYFSQRCACYDDYAGSLAELQNQGLRGDTDPALVLSFEILAVEDDGSFIASVIDQQQPGRRLDAEDRVVQERGVGKAFESNIRVSPEDGAWKVSQIEYVSDGSPGDAPSTPVP